MARDACASAAHHRDACFAQGIARALRFERRDVQRDARRAERIIFYRLRMRAAQLAHSYRARAFARQHRRGARLAASYRCLRDVHVISVRLSADIAASAFQHRRAAIEHLPCAGVLSLLPLFSLYINHSFIIIHHRISHHSLPLHLFSFLTTSRLFHKHSLLILLCLSCLAHVNARTNIRVAFARSRITRPRHRVFCVRIVCARTRVIVRDTSRRRHHRAFSRGAWRGIVIVCVLRSIRGVIIVRHAARIARRARLGILRCVVERDHAGASSRRRTCEHRALGRRLRDVCIFSRILRHDVRRHAFWLNVRWRASILVLCVRRIARHPLCVVTRQVRRSSCAYAFDRCMPLCVIVACDACALSSRGALINVVDIFGTRCLNIARRRYARLRARGRRMTQRSLRGANLCEQHSWFAPRRCDLASIVATSFTRAA